MPRACFCFFFSKDKKKTLYHGHSYTANPLGCAASIANLELLEQAECLSSRIMISKNHKLFCKKWRHCAGISRLESLGTILVVEYHVPKQGYFSPLKLQLINYFMDHRIVIRPLGNILYIMPPYCIKESELQEVYEVIESTFVNYR